jgi:ATP-binding cassette subfamily B multidrug efflux pump
MARMPPPLRRSAIGELRQLLPYLARHRGALFLGGIFLLVANLSGLAIPWYVGSIVDGLKNAAGAEEVILSSVILGQALLLVGLAIVSGIGRFSMRWLMIGSSRRIEFELRNDFFDHLLTLEPAFFQRMPIGDLMARATNDLNAVRMMLGPGIMYTVNVVTTLAIALTLMSAIDGRLTLIGLMPLPLLSLLIWLISGRLHRGFEAIQEHFSRITSRVQENFSGIRVVKAFSREEAETDRFQSASHDYYRRNLHLVRMMALFMPTMRLFSGSALVLILFYGGHAVQEGRITLGQLIAFIQYLILLGWPMTALGWVTGLIQRGSASWSRIRKIMDTQPTIRSPRVVAPDAQVSAPGIQAGIDLRIENLSFSHGAVPVLHGIDLHLPAGGSLGIVGPTASGKTTLLRLLPRLLDTPAGSIFLDGRDITELPLPELRRAIGWVGQEPLIFSETLSRNLRFGHPDASDEDLEQAARDAAIMSEIESFPAGWETKIGERGINLSGGQKQRACLARALLSEARLLILDAPFSSVDTHTEEAILRALRAQLGRRSLILVSHRISTVRLTDEILVLDGGRIVERGAHAELVRGNGLYAQLHERQLLEEGLDDGKIGP